MIKLITFAMAAMVFSCASKNTTKTKEKHKMKNDTENNIYQFKVDKIKISYFFLPAFFLFSL